MFLLLSNQFLKLPNAPVFMYMRRLFSATMYTSS
jgi:hypothetical protein